MLRSVNLSTALTLCIWKKRNAGPQDALRGERWAARWMNGGGGVLGGAVVGMLAVHKLHPASKHLSRPARPVTGVYVDMPRRWRSRGNATARTTSDMRPSEEGSGTGAIPTLTANEPSDPVPQV